MQEPSKKAYDFDACDLEADYYIAWIHRRGEFLNHLRHAEDDEEYRTRDPERFMNEQLSFESNFPDTSRETVVKLQQPDNYRKTKQTDRGGKPLWINVHWKDMFQIQYKGHYTDKVCSSYKFEECESDYYDFSENCEMYFGAVRDDNGHPFLRLRFEYGPSNKKTRDSDPWGPIEIVAKRICDDGPGEFGKRDFSKNEKMRLGFPMNAKGNFITEAKLLKEGTTPAQVADDLETMESLEEKMQAKAFELAALRRKANKMMEDWRRRLDEITIPHMRSPTSQRAGLTANGNAYRNKHGRHSDGNLTGRQRNLINGHTKGNASRRTIRAGNESDASLPPSIDDSLLSPQETSLEKSTPAPTDAADELAAPETSHRAAKRVRLTNGKGYS